MATTTNYAWETPDDTDLVKDGAAAIRTLGSSIDTTTKALNPSTTLGDIEYRSSTANTNTRLGIGSTGDVLTVAGGVPTWAAPAGGGKVLQVVQGTLTTEFSTTSTSFQDTGLSVTITPSSASSKVMVYVAAKLGSERSTSGTSNWAVVNLVRTSTQLQAHIMGYQAFASSTGAEIYGPANFSYLDSPATTSATTYKVQLSALSTANLARFIGKTNEIASIVVMEIGA